MITTDLLKQTKNTIDLLSQQINGLLETRQKRELFKNAHDYEIALKACQYYPSEYYKFRMFDSEITLNFNSRIKKYFINLETNKYNFIRKKAFLDFIKKNNLEYNPDVSHFNIDNFKIYFNLDTNFENIVYIFLKFCNLYLSLYINQDNLFIYNS